MESTRRFKPPWTLIRENSECYVVRDANGVTVAWLYCRDDSQRYSVGTSKLTSEEARRIGKAISRIPEFMTQRQGFHQRGGGPRWRADRPYHVALEDTYIRAHWAEIDALCRVNSLPFNSTGETIQSDGVWKVYEFTWQITAQVTENVYDSPTGRFLLIPQGARLMGFNDSQIAFGQSRVLLVWTRLIMPSGRSIVLERQAGADTAGYAGLEDEVDNHWGAQFKAALLSTLLGVGSQLGATTGAGMNADVITALRRGTSDSMNQTGQRAVQRNLNIQPTLTIRPGFPVQVIVNRDLVIEPYKW